MSKNPVLISYYTGSEYYKKCAGDLVSSCKNLGMDIIMENVKDSGNYWRNTLYKPFYILDKMTELKSDVIWIDADTRIFSYPACFKKWNSDILFASHTGDLQGIKASPIGIKYNDKNLKFIKNWSDICKDKLETNDVDLDHDLLKYELLPLYSDLISIEIMKDDMSPEDFTNGKIIDNGISRAPNKGNDMRIVINKNLTRTHIFDSLNIENFK